MGTTLTVQLISFNLGDYALLIVFTGFLVSIIQKDKKSGYFGLVILGFGFLFYGMKLMSSAMTPLSSLPEFKLVLTGLTGSYIKPIIISAVFTSIIQSSAATLGLVISLAGQGYIEFNQTIPLIFGANIGTCITGALASIGQGKDAKRVALVNVIFKVSGVIIFLPFLGNFSSYLKAGSTNISHQIANAHTVFNLVYAILFLPLINIFAKISSSIIKSDKNVDEYGVKYINKEFIDSPEIALDHALREILRMTEIIDSMFRETPELIKKCNLKKVDDLYMEDDKVDFLERKIKSYLLKLSSKGLSDKSQSKINSYLIIINNLESMGDIIANDIYSIIKKLYAEKMSYSDEGYMDLVNFHKLIMSNFRFLLLGIRKRIIIL